MFMQPSRTIDGARSYDAVYSEGFGTNTAPMGTALFNGGRACGACFRIKCVTDHYCCIVGTPVVVTATNFPAPNSALSSINGGWCNPALQCFDIAQFAFDSIALYSGGIVPVLYRRLGRLHASRIERYTVKETKTPYSFVAELRTMCEEGRLQDTMDYFELVHQGGLQPVSNDYIFLLRQCSNCKALSEGRRVHSLLQKSGVKVDIVLANNLLSMYAKCGSIEDAQQVFDAMRKRDVVSWTAIINAYAEQGFRKEALKLFNLMLKKHLKPNKITFICLLKACDGPAALENGKQIHYHITRRCLETNRYVGMALVDMYVKCGSLKSAWKVFNKIPKEHNRAWNLMIAGYVQNGQVEVALKLFQRMQRAKVQPNEQTFVNVLKACSSSAGLQQGKEIHDCIRQSKLEADVSVGGGLVEMYIRCGSLQDAHYVFDRMPAQAEGTWASLITAYAQCGDKEEISKLSCLMQQEGIKPSDFRALDECGHVVPCGCGIG